MRLYSFAYTLYTHNICDYDYIPKHNEQHIRIYMYKQLKKRSHHQNHYVYMYSLLTLDIRCAETGCVADKYQQLELQPQSSICSIGHNRNRDA